MRIVRIDETLEQCEEHLSSSSAYGTQIEGLLTQSVLVIMYAEFEQKIRALVKERYSSVTDSSIKEFFGSCVKNVHGVKTSDMAGLLSRFGSGHKETFDRKKQDHEHAETSYNSIVTLRHETAHSRGSHASFREVKQFYEEGHVVLDLFREALLQDSAAHTGGET